MWAEHKEKATAENAALSKSKKEDADRAEQEKLDIWGSKDGAAGAALRKTVDIPIDDPDVEAKAEEEEKIKTNERNGKTKRESVLVAEAGKERSAKTEREHRIEVEEKK